MDILYGATEAGLLLAWADARKDIEKGKMLIQANSGDVQAGYQIQSSAKARVELIQSQLYKLDPETYSMFALAGHSQVRASFSSPAASDEEDEE